MINFKNLCIFLDDIFLIIERGEHSHQSLLDLIEHDPDSFMQCMKALRKFAETNNGDDEPNESVQLLLRGVHIGIVLAHFSDKPVFFDYVKKIQKQQEKEKAL